MSVREKAAAAVRELLGNEKSMHDWEHSVRVCKMALRLCRAENGEENLCRRLRLYRLGSGEGGDPKSRWVGDGDEKIGAPAAPPLSAATTLWGGERNEKNEQRGRGGAKTAAAVLEIVSNLGYSKYLSGMQKLDKNGHIVQDADMLDAMGAVGIVRTIVFNAVAGSGRFFRSRDVSARKPEPGGLSEQEQKRRNGG